MIKGYEREKAGMFVCMQYLMIIMNVIFFAVGGGLLALGLVLLLDRFFAADIFGNGMYSAACYIICIGGASVICLSILGFCAGLRSSGMFCLIYACFMGFFAVLLLAAGIVAAVFQTQLEEKMRNHMVETLRDNYGEDPEVTRSWNITQERLACCSVDTNGWLLYRSTPWFKNSPGHIQGSSGSTLRMFVPPQCCKQQSLAGGNEKDFIMECTSREDKPPGQSGGKANNALQYRGCYEALREFGHEHAIYIMGTGITFAVFLIFGVLLALGLYWQIRKHKY